MHIKMCNLCIHLTAINIQMADWVLVKIVDVECEANERRQTETKMVEIVKIIEIM